MADSFDDPREANLALEAIMKAFPRKKAGEYLGDFNQIAVYLERQIAKLPELKTKEGEKTI